MKAMNTIIKLLTALATIAGIVYIVATYGEQIVAWCKKMLASMPKCPACEEEAEVEVDITVEEDAAEAAEEAAEEVAAEEVPVEEAAEAAAEDAEPVADDADFAE